MTITTGIAWGQGFDSDVDQVTTELFYRFQVTKHLAIPPSVQWLINPIQNPEDDQNWVGGLRVRVAP